MGTKVKMWMFSAALMAVISAAAVASAQTCTGDTACVPFRVNVAATVKATKSGVTKQVSATANTVVTLKIPVASTLGVTGVLNGAGGRLGAPAFVSGRDGHIAVRLWGQSYKNAEVSLHTINGKRVLRGYASAGEAAKSISGPDLTAGVYLLSVKGADGNAISSRVTHRGGSMVLNVDFLNENISPAGQLAKEAAESWTINVSAAEYADSVYALSVEKGANNAQQNITMRRIPVTATPHADFTETVNGVSFDMVYIPGGTFTIGCEANSGCPSDTRPVSGVKVNNYFIGKTEVSKKLYEAVVKGSSSASNSTSETGITWYEALDFACKLSQKTGRKYHMTTEAEWEYAAKKHREKLEKIANGSGVSGEEWAYNSWNSTHDGGEDPVGPSSGQHTQKTRRDANGYGDNITARLIRSIEGVGPALRLAVSADMDYPSKMIPTCDIHAPEMGAEPANSYRDPRWVTGSDSIWKTDGTIAIGTFELRAWSDGTARLTSGYGGSAANGQWFTSNNIVLVFVPSSGSNKKYPYIFVDEQHVSLISDQNLGAGFVGRLAKQPASYYDKPAISGLKSGEDLAKAQTNFNTEFKMVDMTNIPGSEQKQDSRLLDGGPTKGWFQDNTSAGGVHHYRKDIDADEFRFTVNQNNGRTMLANGAWFTVNNVFLRVKHSSGYTAEYLYAVTPDETFYHNSFMGYERGDFRMFKKETNGSSWPLTTCGNICSEEIPKGLGASMYSSQGAKGKSTFVPAPCPTGGCK
ncbi:MAG: SUMF1/EgtB/PvdO family nonheme iron enzyme [Chitinispirillales bacterium]|nr:SUMF1/EgtB/PvdO family nonheme iron enzyme [Chitinispirillales bacterium]